MVAASTPSTRRQLDGVGVHPTHWLICAQVREADEQESFLYALPKRGMWLVGSTPGSTVGGLVAYDGLPL